MSATSTPAPSRRWLGLAVIAAAQFMVIMDTSIIGVALPRMQAELGFSAEGLSWVFNANVVAFGGLLLLGGKLSDVLGVRRVFATGWVVLGVGSLVAGLAGTAGVLLGGLIAEYASWPWVFFTNVPIAAVVLVMVPRVLPSGATAPGGRVDVLGALTVTAGLGTAVYAVVQAPEVGWGSAQTSSTLAAAAVLLTGFVVMLAKGRDAMLRPGIFRAPNLAVANVGQLLLGAAWIPMWFFLNLYLQQVLGHTAFPSRAALLPMTALIMVGMVVLAPRALAAVGPQFQLGDGTVVTAPFVVHAAGQPTLQPAQVVAR